MLHAVVWLSGHHHVGLGRLDQYLWPYLAADLEAGRLDETAAEELLAEFFIALNKDSDLYPGIQQGDNGQSLMLGGVTRDGAAAVNPLTWMALRVARDVGMIDPKINLRITAETDLELLRLATELTRKGLGFPQYANDDVVIPALVGHGYDLADARDYTVAACWEFIIPGRGMDVVNIGAVSFPAAADAAIRAGLAAGATFDGILERDRRRDRRPGASAHGPYEAAVGAGALLLRADDDALEAVSTMAAAPSTATSASTARGCQRRGLARGGPAPRVRLGDVAAASCCALEADFAGYEALRQRLAEESPQVGLNDGGGRAAGEALRLARRCLRSRTERSGLVVRPGTGTAMYYLWLARGARRSLPEPVVGATADGRRRAIPSAPTSRRRRARTAGPISVLQSYTKIDYGRICNGGPITLELSDSVFRDDESIQKVAVLVRAFARLGGQQLQINTLNPEQLLDAQAHPELHRNLIVRVWGWSGYFCELWPEYQDHVIARHLYPEV